MGVIWRHACGSSRASTADALRVRHSVRGVRRRIPEVPFSDPAEPFAIPLSDELTQEAEDAPRPSSQAPAARNRNGGSTSTSDPHTQGVKGLNKAPLVELRGRYSNPKLQEQLAEIAYARVSPGP